MTYNYSQTIRFIKSSLNKPLYELVPLIDEFETKGNYIICGALFYLARKSRLETFPQSGQFCNAFQAIYTLNKLKYIEEYRLWVDLMVNSTKIGHFREDFRFLLTLDKIHVNDNFRELVLGLALAI